MIGLKVPVIQNAVCSNWWILKGVELARGGQGSADNQTWKMSIEFLKFFSYSIRNLRK